MLGAVEVAGGRDHATASCRVLVAIDENLDVGRARDRGAREQHQHAHQITHRKTSLGSKLEMDD